MMDLHPGLMIWTIISFIILLVILRNVAWKPILGALDAREQGIKDNIEAARLAREDAEKSLKEYKKQLAESQAEALKMIADARQDAARVKDDLSQKAKKEAELLIEKSRKQIDQERQEAINSIRAELADLVIFSAEKIINKDLNNADHKRLIIESLKENSN